MPEVWIFKEISTLALNIKSKSEAEPGYASKVIYSTRLLIKTSPITLVIQILSHKTTTMDCHSKINTTCKTNAVVSNKKEVILLKGSMFPKRIFVWYIWNSIMRRAGSKVNSFAQKYSFAVPFWALAQLQEEERYDYSGFQGRMHHLISNVYGREHQKACKSILK